MGHVHADLMMQYAHDAQETDEPWERWEYFHRGTGEWKSLKKLNWNPNVMYRRKPKMLSVTLANGEIVSWPEPYTGTFLLGNSYWSVGLTVVHHENWKNSHIEHNLKDQGLLYLAEEDAKEALVARQLIFTQGI